MQQPPCRVSRAPHPPPAGVPREFLPHAISCPGRAPQPSATTQPQPGLPARPDFAHTHTHTLTRSTSQGAWKETELVLLVILHPHLPAFSIISIHFRHSLTTDHRQGEETDRGMQPANPNARSPPGEEGDQRGCGCPSPGPTRESHPLLPLNCLLRAKPLVLKS